MEDDERDFLEEIMEREAAKDPLFPTLVAEAEARQLREREIIRQSAARRTHFDQAPTLRVVRTVPREKQRRNRQGHYSTGTSD